MKHLHGLSLIEIMITIAIVGIFLAIGVPGMRDYLTNTKIRATAESFSSGLNRARVEALMRNRPVRFIPNGTGWTIQAPADGANPLVQIAQNQVTPNSNNLTVAPTQAQIDFNGRGRLVGNLPYSIAITSPVSGNCAAANGPIRCLRVDVTNSGLVKLCDPALAAGDPNAC